jgi:hypothetical protein
MDLLGKAPSRRPKRVAAILLLVFAGLFPAYGYSPTVLLGVYGQGLFSGEQDPGELIGQAGIRTSALLSWRTLVGDDASLALYAHSIGEFNPLQNGRFYDSHNFSLDALIRRERGRFVLETGFLGSLTGTIEGQPSYLRPDWRIGYEHSGNDAATAIVYSGYYCYQPQGTEDSLFQELGLGFTLDPSIRLRYGMEILGGWEYWTDQDRNDLLGSVKGSAGGMIGYFIDWGIGAQGGVRWCVSDDSAEREESNLFIALDTDWAWSPHRQISLELGAFARDELYLWSGTAAQDYEFSMGCDFRGDWTPDDRLYLVAEMSAARKLAADPLENRWSLSARAGIEFSF